MNKSEINYNVGYICNENLINYCDKLPAVPERASMVHQLISAYGLLTKLKLINSTPASYEDLREFHSDLYLDHIKSIKEIDEEYSTTAEDEEYGIGYDCPPVPHMYELVSAIAGGTLTAVKSLILGICNVSINWCGGWHHAHRFGAEGFCYVNDIVIAIEKLRKKFPKVLYIDLDVHHGNGVQDAYNLSKSVFTLSFHKYEPGFYPGSGGADDIGSLVGKGYCANVPLKGFYSDEIFCYVFDKVFSLVYKHFEPDAIVIQCGADALAKDPNGGANLTSKSYLCCVDKIINKKKPTLILGGGGYNFANTARLWTIITAHVIGEELDVEIPEHDYWTKYGPDYMLDIYPSLTRDCNSNQYLEVIISTIKENLDLYVATAKT